MVIDLAEAGGIMGVMAPANLENAGDFLHDFTMRHGIRRLALFGSVLRGEDTPDSDIDLLVEFVEGRHLACSAWQSWNWSSALSSGGR
ncbi:MAG: nucleotidyltransferase family protein [Pseudonocardiaceae bacterium]